MPTEPTPDMLALARKAVAERMGWKTYEDAAHHNHHTDEYVGYYLAALIQGAELVTDWLRTKGNCQNPHCPPCRTRATIADMIERGDHLKGSAIDFSRATLRSNTDD